MIVLYVCRSFQRFLFGDLYSSSFDDSVTLICFSFLVWGWALFPFSGEVRRISHRTFKLMVAVRVSPPSLFRSVTKWRFIWLVDTVESSLSVLSGLRYLVIRVFLPPRAVVSLEVVVLICLVHLAVSRKFWLFSRTVMVLSVFRPSRYFPQVFFIVCFFPWQRFTITSLLWFYGCLVGLVCCFRICSCIIR
jgi:hypothetical protein